MTGAVCSLAYGNLERQLLGRRYVVRRVHDYRMWLDLEDRGISRSLLLFGKREMDHKAMLERVLRPGMSVFDIGANIGYYVLLELGLIGESGRLLAIEPSPANIELLGRNLALNAVGDRVTVMEGAVSDQTGSRSIHLSEQSNLNTFHPDGGAALHLSGETIEVMTYSLPDLAARHGAPDLVRMDVEGHEVEVMGGMLDALRAGEMAPMIIFEVHRSRYAASHDMEAVLRAFFGCGYRVPLLASSWQGGTGLIESRGYRGSPPIPTDGVKRVVFEDIAAEDAIDFICHVGGARTVLLARQDAAELGRPAESSIQ